MKKISKICLYIIALRKNDSIHYVEPWDGSYNENGMTFLWFNLIDGRKEREREVGQIIFNY